MRFVAGFICGVVAAIVVELIGALRLAGDIDRRA